jgi:hypothetical protein
MKICIGRESNPGLAETGMATANFTTKPPMRETHLDVTHRKTAIYTEVGHRMGRGIGWATPP